MYENVARTFYDGQNVEESEELCKGVCQKCKDTSNRVLFGGTRAIVPLGRGELVSADYIGPLTVLSAGVRYLFVIVDNFTKYVRLFTLRRATTAATLRRVRQYSEEFGTPKACLLYTSRCV